MLLAVSWQRSRGAGPVFESVLYMWPLPERVCHSKGGHEVMLVIKVPRTSAHGAGLSAGG